MIQCLCYVDLEGDLASVRNKQHVAWHEAVAHSDPRGRAAVVGEGVELKRDVTYTCIYARMCTYLYGIGYEAIYIGHCNGADAAVVRVGAVKNAIQTESNNDEREP